MKLVSKLATDKRLFAIIAVVLPLSVIAFALPGICAGNSSIQQEELARLFVKTAEEGQVRVIVGLKLPPPGFKPEGTLASPEAVQQQRDAIITAKETLLNYLTGYDEVAVYADYAPIPYMALRIGADALKVIADYPYLKSIQEDSPRGLHDSDGLAEDEEKGI